jgi:ribosomally synthesized peptide (two-chain TOMM family)
MPMESLLKFRTIFLRAIAEAWLDEGFRRELTRNQPGSAIKALKTRFNFDWPWPHVCDLDVADAGDKYQWLRNGWIWSSDLPESLTLHLPLDPYALGIPKEHHAIALADYYRQHTAIFSDDWDALSVAGSTGDIARTPSGVRAITVAPPRLQHGSASTDDTERTPLMRSISRVPSGTRGVAIGPQSEGPIGGFMPPNEDFAAFNVALVAAMAQAWHDKEFRALLLIDAATALHTIRDYTIPWDFTIRINEDKKSKWLAWTEQSGPSHWAFEEKQILRLNLPSRPSQVETEPVALATYNAAGSEYPFTCCC